MYNIYRSLTEAKPCCSPLVETSVAIYHSAIRPSLPLVDTGTVETLNNCIRRFSTAEVYLDKNHVLGHGVFSKCFLGVVGPLDVCIKPGNQYRPSFYNEANILSICCHTNVSYLHGVCLERRYPMLILKLNKSQSLHSVLKHSTDDISIAQWKLIITTMISGLKYLHDQSILHNDIKEDNVMIEISTTQTKSVIIDLGKACLEKFGKMYHLTDKQKLQYKTRHPQIAPDVRDGFRRQDKFSDVYAFGRLLMTINEDKLQIPALTSISQECLKYNAYERLVTNDLYTFIINND